VPRHLDAPRPWRIKGCSNIIAVEDPTHGLASETTYLVRYVGGALAALGPCSGAGSADLDTEQLLGFAGAEMQSADSPRCLSMQS
jgi:hypothetical protein